MQDDVADERSGQRVHEYPTERAGDHSKPEGFGYQHADDTITRRTEREANRDFTISRRRPRKQQRRHILTGNKNDQIKRAEEEGREQNESSIRKELDPFHPGT